MRPYDPHVEAYEGWAETAHREAVAREALKRYERTVIPRARFLAEAALAAEDEAYRRKLQFADQLAELGY